MLEQMLELFLKSGLRPLSLSSETLQLEQLLNRSEITALMMLDLHGEMPMSQLAADLGAPLSTITSLVKRLVRKGYIERTQSAKDQRIYLVRLTDKGLAVTKQGRSLMEMMLSRVQDVLSPEELEQFIRLAIKVSKALQGGDTANTVKEASLEVRKIQIED